MPPPRSQRRHHEERKKSQWRRRYARQKPWGPIAPEKHAEWQERMALLRAHHNKCPCAQCSMKLPGLKHLDVRVRNWAGEME